MSNLPIKVSIVIVTMNHLTTLRKLLMSLHGIGRTKYPFEIIIIDNCSKDETVDYISENYPNVILHVNSKVNGFAHNNNTGVKLSTGDYIFICNPDMILLENSLDLLVEFAALNFNSGIVCPMLLNQDLSYQASIRTFHSLRIIFWRLLSRGRDFSKNGTINKYLLSHVDKNAIQNVDWGLGAAMMIKKDIYLKLGGFDEKYFLYVEDEDICLRCWKLGYSVTYFPKSTMIHDHQRKSSKGLTKMTWYHVSSLCYFFFKHKLSFSLFYLSRKYTFKNVIKYKQLS